ncbi:MAG TPA: uL15 family ribosomal protein [candidate division Zixibacteria bacterium]|nr:uL15 family ribosomal protein [candidate division Zixibacteria bacterium]
MPHRRRKIRKNRGSRTQGWGRVGQHRRTGSKGRRNAGRHKALWSYVIKYDPDYYSKVGFTSPKSLRYEAKIINVGTLNGIAAKLSTEKQEDKTTVDLAALGYTKLLGTGRVTKPLLIKVAFCSRSAAEKVKNAGGQVLMETPDTGE